MKSKFGRRKKMLLMMKMRLRFFSLAYFVEEMISINLLVSIYPPEPEDGNPKPTIRVTPPDELDDVVAKHIGKCAQAAFGPETNLQKPKVRTYSPISRHYYFKIPEIKTSEQYHTLVSTIAELINELPDHYDFFFSVFKTEEEKDLYDLACNRDNDIACNRENEL